MKKLTILLILLSTSAHARFTTLEEKKAWAKSTCENLGIYTESCKVEQINYAPIATRN